MRPYETLFLAVLTLVLLALLVRRKARWLAVGGLVALLLQVTLEAFRWQMVPAYVLATLVLPMASVTTGRRGRARTRFSAVTLLGNLVLLSTFLAAATLPLLFPVFPLPEPSGPHAIGTTYLHLVDEARDELFTSEVGDPRELLVQVWYPAEPAEGSVAVPYTQHAAAWSRVWTEDSRLRWLPFLFNHLELIETHAHPEAPPASRAAPCPVLVFSHGTWQCWKRHTSLLEELASHGYVVLAVSHAYLTPFTLDAEGAVVTFSRSHPRLRELAAESRKAGIGPLEQQVDATWAQDIRFVLDELQRSTDHVFSELLDLERVGVLGFSRGGRAAGLAALQDDRIKAGINIDGLQTGQHLGRDLTCPFLFLTGDGLRGANDFFFQRATAPVYELTLRGAMHANFHDMALTAPIPGRLSGKLGETDPAHGLQLVREYVRAFFDEHLRDRPSPLLADPASTPPEVQLRLRHP